MLRRKDKNGEETANKSRSGIPPLRFTLLRAVGGRLGERPAYRHATERTSGAYASSSAFTPHAPQHTPAEQGALRGFSVKDMTVPSFG